MFTPSTDVGSAVVTSFSFQLRDTGGTANGGVDMDPTVRTQRFNIAAPLVGLTDSVVVPIKQAQQPLEVEAQVGNGQVNSAPSESRPSGGDGQQAPADLLQGLSGGAPSTVLRTVVAADVGETLLAVANSGASAPVAGSVGLSGATQLLEMFRLAFMQSGPVAVGGAGGTFANGAAPVAGLTATTVQAPVPQAEQEIAGFKVTPQAAAAVGGILISAGFVSWAIRAGGLLTTLLMSVPAWRNVDPLPILAPEEDKPKWATDKVQEREEAALAGLWSAGTGHDTDGTAR